VKLAWQFLSDHGHINYGILPQADSAKLRPAPCLRRHSVIVVGAGLAGEWGMTMIGGRNCTRGRFRILYTHPLIYAWPKKYYYYKLKKCATLMLSCRPGGRAAADGGGA
jgi:hypothetical protein